MNFNRIIQTGKGNDGINKQQTKEVEEIKATDNKDINKQKANGIYIIKIELSNEALKAIFSTSQFSEFFDKSTKLLTKVYLINQIGIAHV